MESLSSAGARSASEQRDLVFKEEGGELKFVGDFERLYQTVRDPWGQSGAPSPMQDYYYQSRRRLVGTLQPYVSHTPNFRGLEVGCGHGHVVDLLCNSTCSVTKCWEGLDASPTAVARAKELYPGLQFTVGDITQTQFTFYNQEILGAYDCVLLGQVWWYLLHLLHLSLSNCRELLKPGGLLVISQAFLEYQRYGVSKAHGFSGTLEVFMPPPTRSMWRLMEAHREEPDEHGYYDGLIVLRAVTNG